MRKDIDLNYFTKCLAERLEAIMARQKAQEENEAPVELDPSRVGRLTRMGAIQQQAMAQETGRRVEQERQRIETALIRIQSGTYGYCLKCDEEVTEKRLRFDPSIFVCISCAQQAERN